MLPAVLLLAAAVLAYPEEDDVLVLGDSNLDQAVAEYDYLLVEFYAPWCGHCQKLAPEYAKAATALKANSPPLRIAKVDATENNMLATRYEVASFPTLKFFQYGKAREYEGGRSAEDITSWVREAIKPTMKKANSLEEVKEMIEKKGICVVVFAQEDSEAARTAEISAVITKSKDYILVPSAEIAQFFSTSQPSLVLFNHKEDTKTHFSRVWTDLNISEFVKDAKLPLVMDFTPIALDYAVRKQHPVVFVFRSEAENEAIFSLLVNVAKAEKQEIRFIYGDLEGEKSLRLADYLGVMGGKQPTAVLFDARESSFRRYHFTETDLNEANLRLFISKWRSGLLVPYYKSESEPVAQGAVLQLTRNTYNSTVKSHSAAGLLVFLYTDWCLRCQNIDIAHISHELQGIVSVGKVDVMKNELEGMEMPVYPAFYCYKGSEKGVYTGDFSAESVITWAKETCKAAANSKTEL